MLGAESPLTTVPAVGPGSVPPTRPPPERRVVEDSARASLQREQTGSLVADTPSRIEELCASARQFAEILDSTGSLVVASSVSGFAIGHLDTYA